ncbi:MAG: saccharopine dehydrogenase NADP-binding domain-containing protein, partial [Nitrospinae bacterium]|nr:saccharopine dehydrogenase NADP-binding domain-containing protein [Nitrospinota bacterium]
MKFRYAVLGAGRQGVAAAYDLARLGDAEEVRLVDLDPEAAMRGAERINTLLQAHVAQGQGLDVRDASALVRALKGFHSTLSAVPYAFNLSITEAAIAAGSNICDLGGHTETVRRQLALGDQA